MHNLHLALACEGPLVLNDQAFELCRDFLKPHGDRFFNQVRLYDECLATVLKKPGYPPGNTWKLILPFLKAAGLTNAQVRDHARENLRLTPGAEETLKFIRTQGFPVSMLAAGYRQGAEEAGLKLGFDAEHLFAMEMDLDRCQLTPAESDELRRLQEEIAVSAAIELPEGAASLEALPEPVQATITRLEEIFDRQLPALASSACYREVKPLTGAERVQAFKDSLGKSGRTLAETIYVGDGRADLETFATVRAGGGLAMSFNGEPEGAQAAGVIVVADNTWPLARLIAIFRQWGQEGVLEVAGPESPDKSRYLVLPEEVIEPIARGLDGRGFSLCAAGNPKLREFINQSAAMRARLRGAAIASRG